MSMWPLQLLMAVMGTIIHAVGSMCSFSALESPVGCKDLLEGYVLRTNYEPQFSQKLKACAIMCILFIFNLINLNGALFIQFTLLNIAKMCVKNIK